jgi:hypothetical protein
VKYTDFGARIEFDARAGYDDVHACSRPLQSTPTVRMKEVMGCCTAGCSFALCQLRVILALFGSLAGMAVRVRCTSHSDHNCELSAFVAMCHEWTLAAQKKIRKPDHVIGGSQGNRIV